MGAVQLFVIVRRDLPEGPQAVQSCHAAIEFAAAFPEKLARWFKQSNHLALHSVPDEASLFALYERARERNIDVAVFREPDLGSSLTAIALEPGRKAAELCGDLPRTLGP